MIDQVTIDRFKCFDHLDLPMRRLTVLTGLNGAGKTSVIHALLLARIASERRGTVALNGPYGFALGEAVDVLTLDADPASGIGVAIVEGSKTYRWCFGTGEPGDRQPYLNVNEAPEVPSPTLSASPRAFAYLTAERLGPRDVVEASADPPHNLGVGHAGQYAAQVLAVPSKDPVPERRRHPDLTRAHGLFDLHHQTEWWVSAIVREVEINAEWHLGTNAVSLRFRSHGYRSEWARPANAGFGLSYALPVVVAGLITPASGMLIVENPEAHLHPAGQRAMGAFLARVAADGVQVLIETHSDHVLNGVRLAVHEGEIEPDIVALHFFQREISHEELGDRPIYRVASPSIDKNGRIDKRPEGFFDEWDKSLRKLLKPAKR